MSEELLLLAGDNEITGWTDVRVTRGIERLPSDFQIGFTERYPGQIDEVTVRPGDPCQVLLGDSLVITGYVDRYMPMIQGRSHSITISGRSKCQDLVDCSAEWPGCQIAGSSAMEVAKKLAAPYGIEVFGIADGGLIVQHSISRLSTAYEEIELICRYIGLLAYDTPDGNLLLARVGTDKAASGFQEGTNVEAASLMYSADQRFSEYLCYLNSFEQYSDVGKGGDIRSKVDDLAIKRNRRHNIVAEAGNTVSGVDVSLVRAKWEAARRGGRSAALRITTDGWRDVAGVLWTPNTLVDLDLPSLKVKTADKPWLISEVTYRRDRSGTHADLTVMRPEAFDLQPTTLAPSWGDVPAFAVPKS